jgi:hypothetical protein
MLFQERAALRPMRSEVRLKDEENFWRLLKT